jgi:hypothetical protein
MSPFLHDLNNHEVIFQEGFASAGLAFNDAIDRAHNDLMVFCHEDIYLPERWLPELMRAINILEVTDCRWGVLGCAGRTRDNVHCGYTFSNGLGILGKPFTAPRLVQTLDEIVLIFKRSTQLRFDETLPHFHLYGADICLQAASYGLNSYAINAFCIHNTHELTTLPDEFYQCCQFIRRKWKSELPVQTTCIRLTRFNFPVFRMAAHDFYVRRFRKDLRARACARRPHVNHILSEIAPSLKFDSPSLEAHGLPH